MNRDTLRVGDADRDRAVTQLREACAEGRLTLDEFTQRVDIAFRATAGAELDTVLADLPPSELAEGSPRRWIVGIFGGQDRRGRWRAGSDLRLIDVFGGSDVDLREAVVTAPEISITAIAIFGGSDIIVPAGADVAMSGGALFGGNDLRIASTAGAGAPRIRIRAFSLFGGIDVTDAPGKERR